MVPADSESELRIWPLKCLFGWLAGWTGYIGLATEMKRGVTYAAGGEIVEG